MCTPPRGSQGVVQLNPMVSNGRHRGQKLAIGIACLTTHCPLNRRPRYTQTLLHHHHSHPLHCRAGFLTTMHLRHCGRGLCFCQMLPWLLSILDLLSLFALAGFCVSFCPAASPSHPCGLSKCCCLLTNSCLCLPCETCLPRLHCLLSLCCLFMHRRLLFVLAGYCITYSHTTSHPLDVVPSLNVLLPPNRPVGCCVASCHAATT